MLSQLASGLQKSGISLGLASPCLLSRLVSGYLGSHLNELFLPLSESLLELQVLPSEIGVASDLFFLVEKDEIDLGCGCHSAFCHSFLLFLLFDLVLDTRLIFLELSVLNCLVGGIGLDAHPVPAFLVSLTGLPLLFHWLVFELGYYFGQVGGFPFSLVSVGRRRLVLQIERREVGASWATLNQGESMLA